jgi:hypothetical protein
MIGCTNQKDRKEVPSGVVVFNLEDDDARKEFSTLKLDETHVNMLNPSIAKESHEEAMKSWTDIHYELNRFLKKENFDWGIQDERIKIFNKIYFHKDGSVKYYVYGIHADVTPEKAAEFGTAAKNFFSKAKISLTRDTDFAQCGKASLLNTNLQKS